MEVCESKPVVGESIYVRGVNIGSVATQLRKPRVIHKNYDNVWRLPSGMLFSWKIGFRLFKRSSDSALEFWYLLSYHDAL